MHSPAMASTGRAPASLVTYGSFSGPRYYRPWSAPGGGAVVHNAGRARREKPTARSTGPERLGDRARQAMRLRNFSPRTEKAYLGWMLRYYECHRRLGRAAPRDGIAFLSGFRDFCQNAGVHEFREHDHHIDVVGDTAVASFRYEMVYELQRTIPCDGS